MARMAQSLHVLRMESIHPQEDCGSMQPQDLTVKQAMASLDYAAYFQEGRLAQLG